MSVYQTQEGRHLLAGHHRGTPIRAFEFPGLNRVMGWIGGVPFKAQSPFLNDIQGAVNTIQDLAINRRQSQKRGRSQPTPPGSERGEQGTIQIADFDNTEVEAASQGSFREWANLQVGPQVGYVWGYGSVNAPDFVGRIYGDIQGSGGSNITGTLRLASYNDRDKSYDTHGEFSMDALNQTLSRRDSWMRLEERDMEMVLEDSWLSVEYDASTQPDDGTNSTFLASVTIFDNP